MTYERRMPDGVTVYLIWSIEHDAWWGPARRGYTRDIREAGRYAVDEATEIVADANIVEVNECLIPVDCVSGMFDHTFDQALEELRVLGARIGEYERRLKESS